MSETDYTRQDLASFNAHSAEAAFDDFGSRLIEATMNDKTLVGTYKLASWENRHASGDVTYPLGSDAVGYISYSNEGFVFVHIMARHRHLHSSADLFGGDPGEITDSATSHVSYCGTYQVDGDEVVHTVTVASFPNWIGSEQRRKFKFTDGKLLLSAEGLEVGTESVDAYLVWKRAEGPFPEFH